MNTQSKTSKRIRLVVRGMIMLLAFIGIAFALTSTASHSQVYPKLTCILMCDSNDNVAAQCVNPITHEWAPSWRTYYGMSCTKRLASNPQFCADNGSLYDAVSKTCVCDPGYAKISDGILLTSMGCSPCPADSKWDVQTKSCVCNEILENFDTKTFTCKPRPRPPYHACPIGLVWNDSTQSCEHNCGAPGGASWDESRQSCVCPYGQTFYKEPQIHCGCPNGSHFNLDPPFGCIPCSSDDLADPATAAGAGCLTGGSNAPPPEGCPRGQIKSRNGQCIPAVLLPKTNTNTNTQNKTQKRSVPDAGLLETTPGLSPQGPAAGGTPSKPYTPNTR
jgi:hypothetical protein